MIRAWLPQAREASVVTGGQTHPDGGRSRPGFFTATSRRRPTTIGSASTLYSGERRSSTIRTASLPCSRPFELYLHGEGTNYESYRTLGAHAVTCEGVDGVRFAVWAPNAEVVSVIGDFNHWDRTRHPMRLRDGGIWEIFIPGMAQGNLQVFGALAHRGRAG